ncbi:Holliday junction branch migration protein RuvA [Hutsoniella sourekii]|uniref:Holliday junction branch migration protein RuvA n=1 Tax=Hutsoniella sourekii TaxID=87650 RepID=UPI000481CA52|nr:Holliday junction branch migration protein RuvA [Hutsoniella sourekii]
MYDYLEGSLVGIHPTYVVIDVNGIGYRIYTANPYSFQAYLEQKVRCYIEQVIRDDAHLLYGFLTEDERQLFLMLNRVSGIGPKSALSILAANDHQGLVDAVESGDSKYLTKFPGVGKKTASQIILDLQGKLALIEPEEQAASKLDHDNDLFDTVYEALLGLGYSKREINRIKKPLEAEQFQTTQEALSYAFKLLIK